MIPKHILLITFLNELKVIFCTQFNDSQLFYLTRKIQFTMNHLFTHS